jgi:cytochrome c oxidase cbb3-type subunit 3
MLDDQSEKSKGATATTGHEWDGIRELDTPLPRWWLWVFYATILWSIGYWIFMPAWPMLTGYTRGVLEYSSRADARDELIAAKQAQAGLFGRISAASLDQIRQDPELLRFSLAAGRSAFSINCATCHGAGAAGSKGYPNLNDDDWLWGGRIEAIEYTIRHGIRNTTDDNARMSEMPRFLADGILSRDQVNDIVEYVFVLGGNSGDAAAVARGKLLFAENCQACHGETATGNHELGAPNLADAIGLYGMDRRSLFDSVSNARRGVMPTWEGILDRATIKALAVYVHSLGGGQ